MTRKQADRAELAASWLLIGGTIAYMAYHVTRAYCAGLFPL